MIKSQLLCQLTYAPACKRRLLKDVLGYSIGKIASNLNQMAIHEGDGNNNYSICTSVP
jgi:hypothetical protein